MALTCLATPSATEFHNSPKPTIHRNFFHPCSLCSKNTVLLLLSENTRLCTCCSPENTFLARCFTSKSFLKCHLLSVSLSWSPHLKLILCHFNCPYSPSLHIFLQYIYNHQVFNSQILFIVCFLILKHKLHEDKYFYPFVFYCYVPWSEKHAWHKISMCLKNDHLNIICSPSICAKGELTASRQLFPGGPHLNIDTVSSMKVIGNLETFLEIDVPHISLYK